MGNDKPSRTAYKVAMSIVTLGAKPGMDKIFPPCVVEATAQLLEAGGWTLLMAVNLMLFSLVHNPCSTTVYTIWKETKSVKWTTVSALLPLGMGILLCFFVAQIGA